MPLEPKSPNERGTRSRGREIARPASEVDLDAELEADERDEEFAAGEHVILLPGDTVMAKVTHAVQLSGEDSWFTYGATSRLLPGETEEEAFFRMSTVVNNRVLDLVSDAIDLMHQRQQAFEAQQTANRQERAKTRRIIPQG